MRWLSSSVSCANSTCKYINAPPEPRGEASLAWRAAVLPFGSSLRLHPLASAYALPDFAWRFKPLPVPPARQPALLALALEATLAESTPQPRHM